jgi:hypothetical protein
MAVDGRPWSILFVMLAYFKALAARLAGRRLDSFLDSFLPPAEDPMAGVRAPRRWGPGGRSSAAAVEEPSEPSHVRAHAGEGQARSSAR